MKPASVFLSESAGGELVKLLDFGIAKVAADSDGIKTTIGTFVGTAAYLAPHFFRGCVFDRRGSTLRQAVERLSSVCVICGGSAAA